MTDRVSIIIDGSNFYHRLKELNLGALGQFDYREFGKSLARGREIIDQTYYIGAVREEENNPKSRQLMASQQRLLSHLKNQDWRVELGHMLKTKGTYQEKGVDVHMAVDLVDGAHANYYDTAILVSSDTDLIPAIQKAQKLGKKVEYVGFTQLPSYGLIRHADARRLLAAEDIQPFLPKTDKK